MAFSLFEQMIRNLLENPNEPVSDLSYFDSLDAVMEKSKVWGFCCFICAWVSKYMDASTSHFLTYTTLSQSLTLTHTDILCVWVIWIFWIFWQALGDAMTGISNQAKKGDLEEFCESVRNFASSVCGLTEASTQVR